ncbi:MAG: hypothetical protein WBB07_17535 [Mycobacterium sp.]
MTTCQRCSAPSPSASLCRTHSTELRRLLTELAGTVENGRARAGWIENLADAAHGATKMGGQNGRNTGGDESPIRFNSKASTLLSQVRDGLELWRRDLCEQRGIEYRPIRFVRSGLIGPLRVDEVRGVRYARHGADIALWLEVHCDALLLSEDAGQILEEIQRFISSIQAKIDHPIPMRFCGPCPTQVDHDHLRGCESRHPHACGTALRFRRYAMVRGQLEEVREVTCPTCKATHRVETLLNRLLADLEHWRFTSNEILWVMRELDEALPERTWRRWRKENRVPIRGWRRPSGGIGLTKRNADDEPLYRLSDVRKEAEASIQHSDRKAVAHAV